MERSQASFIGESCARARARVRLREVRDLEQLLLLMVNYMKRMLITLRLLRSAEQLLPLSETPPDARRAYVNAMKCTETNVLQPFFTGVDRLVLRHA